MASRTLRAAGLNLLGFLAAAGVSATTPTIAVAKPVPTAQLESAVEKLPLAFEANEGQVPESVRYLARGRGFTLYLTPAEAVLTLRNRDPAPPPAPGSETAMSSPEGADSQLQVLRLQFVGANPEAEITGIEPLPTRINYVLGNDPASWHTDVPNYKKIQYSAVYPGVDLVFYGNQGELEFDFVVAPGFDPASIRFSVVGAKDLAVDELGDLVLSTQGGSVTVTAPEIYQEVEGERIPLEGSFEIKETDQIGFVVAEYDDSRSLIIDPVLTYSTYFGGSNFEGISGLAVDPHGDIYIAGYTDSADLLTFPAAANLPYQSTHGGGAWDSFVAKINASGTGLVYATYLGGNNDDFSLSIFVDASGNAHVGGYTQSSNFPTTAGVVQSSLKGNQDGYVAKFGPTGNLMFSTYLGGTNSIGDHVASIRADSVGDIYLTGTTRSTDFPVTANAFQPTYAGNLDGFVTKLDSTGSALLYSTYLGGHDLSPGGNNGSDEPFALALDGAGNIYVAGWTASDDFPTLNPIQPFHDPASQRDGFITVLNAAGNALLFSSYFAGSDTDEIRSLVVDESQGHILIAGITGSADLPVHNAAQPIHGGQICTGLRCHHDAFVARLDPSAAPDCNLAVTTDCVVFSTFIGGDSLDWSLGEGLAIDANGNAYVAGYTQSADFPTQDPLPGHASLQGVNDAFVTVFDSNGGIVYSTYLGGTGGERDTQVEIDAGGNAVVSGITSSSDFPIVNGLQPTLGGSDAFIARLATGPEIDVSPLLLDYGDVALPGSNAQIATISNVGGQDLTVSRIEFGPGVAEDLSSWLPEHVCDTGFSGQNWQTQSPPTAVEVTDNVNCASFLAGNVESQNKDVQLTIRVDSSGADNDVFGFALGFDQGDTSNPAADYLVVDWVGPGSARTGLSLVRVTGALDASIGAGGLVLRIDPAAQELARALTLGSTEWFHDRFYDFEIRFTATSLEIFVDDLTDAAGPTLEFDVSGIFSSGGIALYNYSQAKVLYRDVGLSSSAAFSLTSIPTLPLLVPPQASADVEVTFAPTTLNLFSGVLEIDSDDEDEGTVGVGLVGSGVASEAPPAEQIANMLEFLDESVAAGTLAGSGPGNSGSGRLNALKNQIEAAGDLIDAGMTAEACGQLLDALQRTDGSFPPPDFIEGEATAQLKLLIEILREQLGCD